MSDIDRRTMIAGASLIGAVALARAAKGGDLNPPPGPVSGTGRSLRDVEPRVPISSLAPGSGGLHQIISSGSYYLTGDIDVPAGMDGIVVKCNGPVAIDLKGFTIRGSGPGGGSGRGVSVSGFEPALYLEIFDGFIRDCDGDGIDGGAAGTLEVDDVHITGCDSGVRKALGRLKCSDVTLERSGLHGIVYNISGAPPGALTTLECTIDDCEASECGGSGIFIEGDFAWTHCSIWVCDCDCHRCGVDGIGGNFGSTPGLNGGECVALTVADCVCTGNGRFGIGIETPMSPGGLPVSVTVDLNDCTCAHNGQHGLKVNQVAGEICDFQCERNGGHGIELDHFTGSVECCLCSHNGGHGLSSSSLQGTIEDVECRSNLGDGMRCQSMSGNIDGCIGASNGGAGLRVTSSTPGCLCTCDCGWSGNTAEGFHSDATCTGISITECEARNNGTGFRIDGPNNVLLWNTASGNGANYLFDPVTCPNVVIAPSDMFGNPSPHANYSF